MLTIFKKNNPIENFWIWFNENNSMFNNINDQNRDDLLDTLLERLHKIQEGLSVEVSEEFKGKRDIVISAEGDRDLFPIVQKIVGAAPKMEGWTVTAFRQPVNIDFTLEYQGLKFKPSQMFFFPVIDQDTLDLIIYAKSINKYDSNTVNHYGLITMDNVLGEYDCVTKVRYYDFHDLDEGEDKRDLRPLKELRAFVDSFHSQKKNGL